MIGIKMSAPQPLVSVIIPTYNRAHFLPAAIDSVLAQDYQPYELIVVDDGSTDGTAAILQAYPQVRSIFQPNQGQSVARNKGVAASRGEFIAFLDSDDLWSPNKLTLQVRFHLSNPQFGYSIAHAVTFYEADCPRASWPEPEMLNGPHASRIPSSLMVHRDVFERIGGFNPLFRLSEDLDWFLRAQDTGMILGILPETLLQRRIHDANISARQKETFLSSMLALKATIERKRAQSPGAS